MSIATQPQWKTNTPETYSPPQQHELDVCEDGRIYLHRAGGGGFWAAATLITKTIPGPIESAQRQSLIEIRDRMAVALAALNAMIGETK